MSDLIDGRKCEHCGEYADDLASARPSDRHAPDFCGDCRAAMFTPRDLIDALTRAGIAASWQVAGDGDAAVSCAGGAVVIRESAGGWTLHDEDIRCAVVACEYAAADGTPAESWLEDVDDVVALVQAVTAGGAA